MRFLGIEILVSIGPGSLSVGEGPIQWMLPLPLSIHFVGVRTRPKIVIVPLAFLQHLKINVWFKVFGYSTFRVQDPYMGFRSTLSFHIWSSVCLMSYWANKSIKKSTVDIIGTAMQIFWIGDVRVSRLNLYQSMKLPIFGALDQWSNSHAKTRSFERALYCTTRDQIRDNKNFGYLVSPGHHASHRIASPCHLVSNRLPNLYTVPLYKFPLVQRYIGANEWSGLVGTCWRVQTLHYFA